MLLEILPPCVSEKIESSKVTTNPFLESRISIEDGIAKCGSSKSAELLS